MSDTQNTINWQGPLEAFNETSGAVWSVQLIGDTRYVPRDTQPMRISPALPDGAAWFGEDGNHPWSVWRIRNVAQPKVMQDHMNAEGGATRTTDEQLTHYAERCKALVEKMAKYGSHDPDGHSYDEDARAIVASMVEVDPDEQLAHDMATARTFWNSDELHQHAVALSLAAIRRGRALERGE